MNNLKFTINQMKKIIIINKNIIKIKKILYNINLNNFNIKSKSKL